MQYTTYRYKNKQQYDIFIKRRSNGNRNYDCTTAKHTAKNAPAKTAIFHK